jgi:hypothetical protein
MNRADILNAIRYARREANSFSEHESETMSGLKEQPVKRGVAKLEHFFGAKEEW